MSLWIKPQIDTNLRFRINSVLIIVEYGYKALITSVDLYGLETETAVNLFHTGAEPLLGPRVFTSFPSISKPSVGRAPSGRAGLSPTCSQSTYRETLTWLTDR